MLYSGYIESDFEGSYMRVFVAIEITDPQITNTVKTIQDKLASLVNAKPVCIQKLHFTLQFLGEVATTATTDSEEKIIDALNTIKFSSFDIDIKGVGAFPNSKNPRVIWVGIDNANATTSAKMQELAGKVANVLTPLGFSIDKPFVPHVTILRVKRHSKDTSNHKADVPEKDPAVPLDAKEQHNDIVSELSELSDMKLGTQRISAIKLKQSQLTPKGAIYSDLAEISAQGIDLRSDITTTSDTAPSDTAMPTTRDTHTPEEVIISKIHKSVVPSNVAKTSIDQTAKEIFGLVSTEIFSSSKYPQILNIEFGGSYAKGTWLEDGVDIDIYIRFKKQTSSTEFEVISKKIGFSALKKYSPYVRYAEHPYVEANMKGTKINIVPFYDVVKGNWISSADRSPYHTKYMKDTLTPKMRDDIRILKKFLKINGLYGAEIAKQGFSGYVAEVLISEFGSFWSTINTISKMRQDATTIIGRPKKVFDTKIVIVDPVDANRNLAAAISNENIGRFILACRSFVKRPTLEAFEKKHVKTISTLKEQENLLVVKFHFEQETPDTIWGQLKKATSSLSKQLESGGFTVFRSDTHANMQKKEAHLFFLLATSSIPLTYINRGPDIFRKKDVEQFVAKNKDAKLMWVAQDCRIVSLKERKMVVADTFVDDILRDHLVSAGVPSGIIHDIKRGYTVWLGIPDNVDKSVKTEATRLISTDDAISHYISTN